MNFLHAGSAYGREIYIESAGGDEEQGFPSGYSIAAVVLSPGWKAEELCWTLNALYGNLAEWNAFESGAGARSFAFYGERADEASNICDALAFAWTAGDDAEYEDVVAASHDEATPEEFVENLFSGEILAGEKYAQSLQNLIFAVSEVDLADRVTAAVKDAVARHRFD
ncbi:MAG TPA: hypothetical protein VFN37_13795 [Candidatus Baltobacteraceae bacterium]|nr:hypothetical protein [Candidatus Baltobacteraceae bacterium]